MGGRYIVTGTELGMLVGLPDQERRQKLVDEIIKERYVCDDILIEDLIRSAKPTMR